MYKFMVVCCEFDPEDQYAVFCDDYMEAERAKMNCECGLGGEAKVYELNDDGEYEFLYA